MPKKTGVCINISNCSKARNRELQTVEATKFVCEECGKDLKEKIAKGKSGGGDKKKLFIVIAAVIAIIVALAIIFIPGGETEQPIVVDEGSEETIVVDNNEVEVTEVQEPIVEEPVSEEAVPTAPYTYEGDTKDGVPHGNGTMVFNKKMIVPGSKGNIQAEAGEYAQGKWVNGEVNLVTLYQKSGNRVLITHK